LLVYKYLPIEGCFYNFHKRLHAEPYKLKYTYNLFHPSPKSSPLERERTFLLPTSGEARLLNDRTGRGAENGVKLEITFCKISE